MAARNPLRGEIKLHPLANGLFTTEEERQEARGERIVEIPLNELYPFPDHPYRVRNDDEMQTMAESIRDNGVLIAAVVRPRVEGGYEIISGHRRKMASELAGLSTMPAVIRDVDDDTALIYMVDSNNQREHITPCEKGRAYKMKMAAVARKRGRPSKTNSGQVGPNFDRTRSNQVVADDAGESVKQVQRYIRLNELIPELQKMVDDDKLAFTPAVAISYIKPDEQTQFLEYIQENQCTPTLSQAQQLKAVSKKGELDEDRLKKIMISHAPSVKPREPQVSIPVSKVAKYFPKGFTATQIQEQILKMLEANFRRRQQNQER